MCLLFLVDAERESSSRYGLHFATHCRRAHRANRRRLRSLLRVEPCAWFQVRFHSKRTYIVFFLFCFVVFFAHVFGSLLKQSTSVPIHSMRTLVLSLKHSPSCNAEHICAGQCSWHMPIPIYFVSHVLLLFNTVLVLHFSSSPGLMCVWPSRPAGACWRCAPRSWRCSSTLETSSQGLWAVMGYVQATHAQIFLRNLQ